MVDKSEDDIDLAASTHMGPLSRLGLEICYDTYLTCGSMAKTWSGRVGR